MPDKHTPITQAQERYEVYTIDADAFDVEVRSASENGAGNYLLHIARDPDSVAHCTLHRGHARSDTIVAATKFEEYFKGQICAGDPNTTVSGASLASNNSFLQQAVQVPWSDFSQPVRRDFIGFTVGGHDGLRSLRWHRTEQAARSGMLKVARYIVWVLDDITGVETKYWNSHLPLEDRILATFTIAGADVGMALSPHTPIHITKGIAATAFKKKALPGEVGDLSWITSVDLVVKEVAIAMLLTLWHSERAIRERGKLGPYIDIELPVQTPTLVMGAHKRTGSTMGNVSSLSSLGNGVSSATC